MPENTNDKGYRRMLGRKRNFLEFAKQHIAAPWAGRLREDDIELVNSRFVTKGMKDRESDIVYRARIDGEEIYFFILLELQSYVDPTMPFRFLEYMAEMYGRLFYDTDENIRQQKGFRLPAVVPILLYNGADEWSCARSFGEYLSGGGLFAPNAIDFEYIMINVNAPDEPELVNTPTLVNLAMLLDRKGGAESFMRRIKTALSIVRRLTADEQAELRDWITDVTLKKARD
ncbi:MAG: Rpn family recombination-promoting nuclease/putative transposase, partial [Clostridiales bacterium]|nr:Rpn family recombination-promoting nuclease/putative transposase [Clostridiales bacterium]